MRSSANTVRRRANRAWIKKFIDELNAAAAAARKLTHYPPVCTMDQKGARWYASFP